jgi:hypothetical protein
MSNIDIDYKTLGDGGRSGIMSLKKQVFFGGFFGFSLCKKQLQKKGSHSKKIFW